MLGIGGLLTMTDWERAHESVALGETMDQLEL